MRSEQMIRSMLALSAAVFLLSACAHHREGGNTFRSAQPMGKILLKYDLNHDGKVTRAELEEGLHAEFAAADKNHDGCLDAQEILAYNDARWQANHSATPLVDWQKTNCIRFDTFAAEKRSLFEELDLNNDGVLTDAELNGMPAKATPSPLGDSSGTTRPRRRGGSGDTDGD